MNPKTPKYRRPCFTRYAIVLTSAVLLAGSAAAMAQTLSQPETGTTMPTADGAPGRLSSDDRSFFSKAAISGLAEVAEGQLAQQQSQAPDVQTFGKQMVQDHGTVNEQLKTLAAKKGVTLGTAPDAEHREALDKLRSKSGKDFDSAYAKQEVSDHEDAISLFKKASKSSDAEIAAFAQKVLPTLQHHLDMAKQLKSGH